jgi:hypothetical protein
MKTPKKVKSVGFVSGAWQCRKHKVRATMNNFFFAKK